MDDSLAPNFSPKSQYFITKAKELAFNLGHSVVKDEHLLLLLLESEDEFIKVFLRKHQINLDDFINFVKVFGQLKPAKSSVQKLDKIEDCGFSASFKACLSDAHKISEKFGTHYIGNDHLFFSLINRTNGAGCTFFESIGKIPQEVIQDFVTLLQVKNLNLFNSNKNNQGQPPPEMLAPPPQDSGKSLTNFCVNLNEMAELGKIDNVIGRDKEISRMHEILGRRIKNNPILVGDPGVGKTACVEGLALSIVQNQCPHFLRNYTVYAVDIASMVAGTKYRGQFEQRLKNLIQEVSDADIILFIDEAHTLIGAGSAEGSLDAANILKPALARGQIKLITATTFSEYKKSIEKDTALSRRLENISVEEPSKQDCISILEGIKSSYEDFHGVKYSQKCIKAIVELADEYIPSKFFPDKAIDILDEAGSALKISNLREPPSLIEIESQLYDLHLGDDHDYKIETELLDRYEDEYKKWTKNQTTSVPVELIQSIVAKKAKVPLDHVCKKSSFNIDYLKRSFNKDIIGQKEATDSIISSIIRSKVGLNDKHKPISSFLFLGLTGTGKTHCAKVLAEKYMGNSKNLIRLDMSEYSDKISSTKLIGSAPGYVGHEEGGHLIEKMKKQPHSVVLFDEIEKSHPDVRQLLLQILEEGELEDSLGNKAYFKDSIIILTSNIGAHLLTKSSLGFNQNPYQKDEEVREHAVKLLSPELFNRIDDVVLFQNLSKESLKSILSIKMKLINKKLKKHKFILNLDDDVFDFISENAHDTNMGARPLDRILKKEIEDPVCNLIVKNSSDTIVNVDFYLADSKIKLKVS